MNIITGFKNLLFNQKAFFADAPKGFLVPVLITLIYAVVAVIASLPALTPTLNTVGELAGFVIGVTVVSTIIVIFATWIIVSLIFFACVKVIGYAKCSFKEMLRVISYPAVILTISSVITGLITLIGTPNAIATLILSGAFLVWTIPIWVFGIQSITEMEVKKIVKCIAAPVIIMIIITIVSTVMAMSATVPAV
ncbi:MAG: YIP1 family protein [Methanocorpusculum sp.]|nr:YIP1 family protein [Methanocorpusculum sp.]